MNQELLMGLYELEVKAGRVCLTQSCWQERAFSWALLRHEDMLVLILPAPEQADANVVESGTAVLDDAGCFALPQTFCDDLGGEETVMLTGMGSFAQIMKASAQEQEDDEAADIDALLDLLFGD